MYCGYCARAKQLLKSKNVNFKEIDVSFSRAKRIEMETRTGGDHKVPQIWIGERHVGGSDALVALERLGELDALLAVNGC
jgi:glutaredoxin 3